MGEGTFQQGREAAGCRLLHPPSRRAVPGGPADPPCWLEPLLHSTPTAQVLPAVPIFRETQTGILAHVHGGLPGLPWDPGHSGSFLRGPGLPGSGGGGPPSSAGESSLGGAGLPAQTLGLKVLFVHQVLRKGLLAIPLPCCSSLSPNTHGFYHFPERGPRTASWGWENPRGAGQSPVSLVLWASSPGLHRAMSC